MGEGEGEVKDDTWDEDLTSRAAACIPHNSKGRERGKFWREDDKLHFGCTGFKMPFGTHLEGAGVLEHGRRDVTSLRDVPPMEVLDEAMGIDRINDSRQAVEDSGGHTSRALLTSALSGWQLPRSN